MKRPQEAQHGWQLHQKLQPAADYRSPGDNNCQTGLTLMSALPEKCRDNSHIPDDWSGVRKQELAMAVENAQAPGGENQKSCAGKKVLQEIGNAESRAEGIGGIGIAEIVREHAIANQASDPAEQNASCYRKSGRSNAQALFLRISVQTRIIGAFTIEELRRYPTSHCPLAAHQHNEYPPAGH